MVGEDGLSTVFLEPPEISIAVRASDQAALLVDGKAVRSDELGAAMGSEVFDGGVGPLGRRPLDVLLRGQLELPLEEVGVRRVADRGKVAARREILDIRRDAGLDGPFTFSFSAGPTRFADEPDGGWPPPPARAPEGSEFRYAPEFWVAPDNRPRLVGSPDDLVGDLRLLQDAGVDHVTLRFGSVDSAPLERFAADVMPAFA